MKFSVVSEGKEVVLSSLAEALKLYKDIADSSRAVVELYIDGNKLLSTGDFVSIEEYSEDDE